MRRESMMKHILTVILAALAFPALAASTINPALPAGGLPYTSSPIRSNFQAAVNDINALQSLNIGTTQPFVCNLASAGAWWLNNTTTTYVYNQCDGRGATWFPVFNIDTVNNILIAGVGGGIPLTIASGATTDLGSVPEGGVLVSGSAAIASLGTTTPAGQIKFVEFTGTPTLDYNATSLILPTGANITAAAGDTAIFLALGSGNWIDIAYQRATGDALALTIPAGFITATMLQAGIALTNLTPDLGFGFSIVGGLLTSNLGAIQGHTASLATLKAITAAIVASAGYTTVMRDGYTTAGDGGGMSYVWSPNPCSIGSGSGDNGAQVDPTGGGGCWVADFPASGADIRVWGAVGDWNGSTGTDNHTAITTAITSAAALGLSLSGPANGFYSSTALAFGAVPVFGESPLAPGNPANGFHLVCPAGIASPCVTSGTTSANGMKAGAAHDLWVSFYGSPISGDVGFETIGYNTTKDNVLVTNAYDGLTYGDSATVVDGIAAHDTRVFTWNIVHDHVVVNSFPEVYISNSRFGTNGVGDVAANAYLGITGTDSNTISCTQCQFNQGNVGVSYLIDFFNVVTQPNGIYTIDDSTADMTAGAGATAVIHSDGTGTCLRCIISNTNILAVGAPMFSMGAAGGMQESKFDGDNLFVASFTMPNVAYSSFNVSDTFILGSLTIAGSGTAGFSNIVTNGATALGGGVWSALGLTNMIAAGGWTDTATGTVHANGVPAINWTPSLTFGGTATGLTYAARTASAVREPDGTVSETFGLNLSAVGSSTGTAVITGAPYTCQTWGFGTTSLNMLFASGTTTTGSEVLAYGTQGQSNITLANGVSGAITNLDNTAFTNSSLISGTIRCPIP